MDIFDSVSYNKLEEVKNYIENGGDINLMDIFERTPLMIASFYGHLDIVKYLVSKNAKLNIQAEDSQLDSDYRYLDEFGLSNGNYREWADERTPLMLASRNGHLEVVKYLVSVGADINIQDIDGQTALMLAKENKKTEIADYLISIGAK